MSISNTTYYESLVTTLPIRRAPEVNENGYLEAPMGPGIGLPEGLDYPPTLSEYVATVKA